MDPGASSRTADDAAGLSPDARVRIWALDLDDLLAISEHEVSRELTDDECRQCLHVTGP